MLSNPTISPTTSRRINWTLLLIVMALCVSLTHAARIESMEETSTEVGTKTESDEVTDLETKEEPYPSVWTMMYDFWQWITGGYSESKNSVGEPRTFGKIRRMQMALIPIVFKFGIISAMITVLVFLALKTVFLLKMLLLLNAGAILAKIVTYKSDHYQHQPAWTGYNGWSTSSSIVPSGWNSISPQNKEIHLHIHGGHHANHGWDKADYSAYTANGVYADAANELNNPGPLPYLRQHYSNHQPYYTNNGR